MSTLKKNVYTHKDFKEVARVGMKVREPEGLDSPCAVLSNGNVGTITRIENESNLLWIDNCFHWFSGDNDFIEVVEDDGQAYLPSEYFYSMVNNIVGISLNSSTNQTKQSTMSKAVNFVKNQALKISNPGEYELRKAGLHDDCGDLTSEGASLHNEFLRKLTLNDMVQVAKEMNAENKANES